MMYGIVYDGSSDNRELSRQQLANINSFTLKLWPPTSIAWQISGSSLSFRNLPKVEKLSPFEIYHNEQKLFEKNNTSSEYLKKLRDPRWQKIRLLIFERDNWKCQICLCDEKNLQVHHKYYFFENDPWDYPLDCFLTLCEVCHKSETINKSVIDKLLIKSFRKLFLNKEIEEILKYLDLNSKELYRLLNLSSKRN